MKLALLVNPVSGGKRGQKMLPQLLELLKDRSISYDLSVSSSQSDLFQTARHLNLDAYDAVAAMGGDGTNYQILNGLLAGHAMADLPPLALIPSGSGNSFAMDLGIFNPTQAVEAIVRNRPRPVDLISFTQGEALHYFLNLTGFGFVTDVARTASRFKRLGDLSYLIGVFHRTLELKHHGVELILDGVPMKRKNCFVEICNSRFTGGKMCMAPRAKIDDGFMDVIIVDPLNRMQLIAALPRLYGGTHVELPQVSCLKARHVSVRSTPTKTLLPDGEIFGNTPAEFNLIHQGVRFLA